MPRPPLLGIDQLVYGGDYNPEQWPPEVWREDVRLMQLAHVNCMSVGIFSWAWIEPRPGVFEFGWLDEVLDVLHSGGIKVNLATATASPPAWLCKMHPETLPVRADGTRLRQGSRQHYAPFSPAFRYYAERLVRKIASRYSQHPALASWHINNEYACHVWESFDPATVQGFRHWLEQRHGSIEALNRNWGTAFWSQRYANFDEIGPPAQLPTAANPAQALDWRRFSNAVLLDLCRMEIAAIREHSERVPISTNFMGFFPWLDQFEWAKDLDYASWDSYPDPSLGQAASSGAAMAHDLSRSLKGKPFILMEQASNQVNWRDINAPKAPGEMRALSYQALAHGADGVCFFQWRASRAGAERFHSAMVPHTPAEESRVFGEVATLGQELSRLGPIVGSETRAQVALLFDWTSRWALLERGRPACIDPAEEATRWYRELHAHNVAVDFQPPDADLSRYKLAIAPALYLLREDAAQALAAFVRAGGHLVVTFFSGVVDEHEQVGLGGYPAKLRELLGAWVEEWHPLTPAGAQTLRWAGDDDPGAPVEHWSELLHTTTASTLAHFGSGALEGRPALTVNSVGQGRAYYVATRLGPAAQARMLDLLLGESGVRGVLSTPAGVEATLRHGAEQSFLFLINHTDTPRRVALEREGLELIGGERSGQAVELEGRGVRVIALDA